MGGLGEYREEARDRQERCGPELGQLRGHQAQGQLQVADVATSN